MSETCHPVCSNIEYRVSTNVGTPTVMFTHMLATIMVGITRKGITSNITRDNNQAVGLYHNEQPSILSRLNIVLRKLAYNTNSNVLSGTKDGFQQRCTEH